MAISKVVVVDGNNLIVRIDRGVAGRGVTDVEPVEISGSLYLVFTFSDGTTETVGPVGTVAYVGQSPIVINASTISLSTVPVNLGGTGQVTANAGFNALAPAQTGNSGKYLKTDGTNSAWDLLDISTADITGTLPIVNGGTGQTTANASFNALAPNQATNTGKYLKTDGTNTSWDLLDISTADITGTLAITNGGTGATTASGARTNLNAADQATTLTAGTGLSGGGDLSANRTFSITNTGVSAASYGSASNTLTATVNAQGQLTALAATPIAIANTQISGLGTISTQNANAVAITGGSITGITDLAVADGGTGASDAAGARTNLNAANQATTITAGTGLSGGGDLSANRTIDIANTTVTAGSFGSASNTLTATVNAQGQLTALAATPIAIANTQVSGLGTLSTQNSNAVTITGGSITGITDLAIADGGTGASNAADARSNLGLGSAAVLNAGVALGVATLDAGGTVPLSQIPASIQGGVSYQGAWNASTNTPTLVSSVGSKGYYYVVSVSGNTNLNGVTDWLVGDWAIYNGTAWQKIDNTDQVASVNGYTGVVVLSNTDVGAPPTSLTISSGTGLSGGGNLTTNRTLSIANTTVTAAPYGTASAVPTFTVNGQGQLTAAADVTIAIANTQVSGLGTISTQNANSVAITGGSITGITDLAVADGGTGASNATDARSNLSAAYNAITISAGTGLTGGGDLTANRTLAIDSSVVTLTGTQTLTNKTLTSPLVNEILDTNGNEILGLSPTASATDFVTVKNGIGTGVPLHIYADGPSTNIGLHLQPKGSGLITISDGTDFNKGIRFRSSGSAASAVTLLDAVSTAGRVVTLPDATTTLVGRDTTDTLTNKTIAFGSNTFSGSLAIANGGTGQTTANAAFNALAPSQTGNSGKYLTTDGTDTSWASNPLGTVTSVAASVPSFLSIAGSPITTSGTLAISLSGTALPTTSGGTGLTSFTANQVFYASSTSAFAQSANFTFNGTTVTASNLATTGVVQFSTNAAQASGSIAKNATYGLTYYGITGSSYDVTLLNNVGNVALGVTTGTTNVVLPSDASINGLTVGRGSGAVFSNTAVGASALVANTTGSRNAAGGWASLFGNTTGVSNTAFGYQSGFANTTGSSNSAFGDAALSSNTTGGNNTALGYFALQANTTASNNTAVGYHAAYTNTTGIQNTAIGNQALYTASTANNNTAVGHTALYTTTAGGNTAVGLAALYANTTGADSAAFGAIALRFNTTGTNNVALGYAALYSNTTASNNTAVGYQAAYSNTTGSNFVAVGYGAMSANTTGQYHTAVGRAALVANTTGGSNSAFGYNALSSNTTGSANVGLGHEALATNLTASNNTAVGFQAGYSNASSPELTAIGYQAGFRSTGGYNTFVGHIAGINQSSGDGNTYIGRGITGNAGAGLSTGNTNTAVGNFALSYLTSGSNNVAIGANALDGNTTGSNNTALGYQAGYSNTTGGGNLFLGYQAGYYTSTASGNSFAGRYSGLFNTTGAGNTAFGDQSYAANTTTATGNSNSAFGQYALYNNTSGSTNTALGAGSLQFNTTGYDNTAVGYQALYSTTTGFENTAVGRASLRLNTTGTYNTAVGIYSLTANTTGYANTGVGRYAGQAITTGYQNTMMGNGTGQATTTGNNNSFFGEQAGYYNTTGSSNTGIGRNALNQNTTASFNTAVGQGALNGNTTGTQGTAMGHEALVQNTTGNYNTAFGYQAGYTIVGGSNITYVGRQAGFYATGGDNTFIGYYAGGEVTTGAKNTILGKYNGNQGGLDIRTGNNYIVLSDGDGNPIFYASTNIGGINGTFFSANITLGSSTNFDNVKKCGMYRVDNGSTGGPTSDYYALLVFGNGDNVVTQIANQLATTTTYVRSFNTSWTAWARLDT